MPTTCSRTACLLFGLLIGSFRGDAWAGESTSVKFLANGKYQLGMSLARDATTWLILASDGQLHYLDSPSDFREVKPLDQPFQAMTAQEMQGSLMREFGPQFEVVVTSHFLVVQPKGRGQVWPQTFEKLHQQFKDQMRRRGVRVRDGKFPMVAIVLPDRAALQRELTRQGIHNALIAGVYISSSNRVYTYDSGDTTWTMSVLRHEAAHQSAFNSSVHSRLNNTPKWITEGLGMMFEPAGMASGGSTTLQDRVQRTATQRLALAYKDVHRSLAYDLQRLIMDDRMFERDGEVDHAYNLSWLMMFYLSEKRPAKFTEIINFTAARPPFADYTSPARLRDFTKVTSLTVDQLAQEVTQWLIELNQQ